MRLVLLFCVYLITSGCASREVRLAEEQERISRMLPVQLCISYYTDLGSEYDDIRLAEISTRNIDCQLYEAQVMAAYNQKLQEEAERNVRARQAMGRALMGIGNSINQPVTPPPVRTTNCTMTPMGMNCTSW